jgi:hypothetical protein
MRDLAGPALVEGHADSPVEFRATDSRPGSVIRTVPAHGQFRARLPEGKYIVRCHGEEPARVFLPAGTYELDLRPGQTSDYWLSKLLSGNGEVRIRVSARGNGAHRFRIRTDNLTLPDGDKELILTRGSVGTLEWQGSIRAPDTPWIPVVTADENPTTRKELMGAAWEP